MHVLKLNPVCRCNDIVVNNLIYDEPLKYASRWLDGPNIEFVCVEYNDVEPNNK